MPNVNDTMMHEGHKYMALMSTKTSSGAFLCNGCAFSKQGSCIGIECTPADGEDADQFVIWVEVKQ